MKHYVTLLMYCLINRKVALLAVVALALHICSYSQVKPSFFKEQVDKEIARDHDYSRHAAEIKHFYACYGYNAAWISNHAYVNQLIKYVESAEYLGLRKEDYRPEYFNTIQTTRLFRNSVGISDSISVDVAITAIAIHFFRNVAYGNTPPEIRFNGLNYIPACMDIPALLSASLKSGKFHSILDQLEPDVPEYISLKHKLMLYTRIKNDSTVDQNPLIKSARADGSNKPLIKRLLVYGLVAASDTSFPAWKIKAKINEAQQLFSLPVNGVVNQTLISELNQPLKSRIKVLRTAINTIRWLRCIKVRSPYLIVVNIPSATLLVYAGDRVAMESRIIVGKPSTRTPVFCSSVSEVVLYPYWMVPKSIATKELLPKIRRNVNYLYTNNLQVMNQQGKVVNPSEINWQQLSASYFPYILRQSTGCDNSLGLIKLNFYNPFGVYLHDTPTKSLFNSNRRFFSHGCMRVQKAMELAHIALKGNTIAIDTVEDKGCLRNQRPIAVPATQKMPVFVLYNTAWVDSAATVRFYPDIYNKL